MRQNHLEGLIAALQLKRRRRQLRAMRKKSCCEGASAWHSSKKWESLDKTTVSVMNAAVSKVATAFGAHLRRNQP